MILSQRHEFVFVKTVKTAGASILLALALAGCDSTRRPQAQASLAPAPVVELHDLCWSADGRALYFTARCEPSEKSWSVFRYELGPRALVRLVPAALGVACDPSGPRIVVARLSGKSRDLFLLDRDGKDLARLTQDPGDELGATWSADGKQLAYEQRTGEQREIYLLVPGGAGPRRLSASGNSGEPSWSPDNKYIAYSLDAGEGKAQIWLMNADGTDPRNLTHDTLNNVSPAWLPDGRIVYASGMRGAPTRILTIGVDGGGKRPVPGLEADCARFSRDGSKVAYFGREPVLIIAGADGTRIDRLAFEAIAAADAAH